MRLPFQRVIRMSIWEISELGPKKTGVRSEGKAFSLDCEVETWTTGDSGTIDVRIE